MSKRQRNPAVSAPPAATPSPEKALRLEWRTPAELAENPRNWRRHPEKQLTALAGALAEVGWAGACLYNEATGRLIDGHARRKVALEQGCAKVPVLVGSWTPEQEALILATLDPLASMASADAEELERLLGEVQPSNEELASLLTELAAARGPHHAEGVSADPEPPAEFPEKDEDLQTAYRCPSCGYAWSGKPK